MTEQTRGVRNNNPLNIRFSKEAWQGKVPAEENTDAQIDGKPEFEQYLTPVWGIRAGARLIINHFDKRKADTIEKLIEIWAPPYGKTGKPENNTPSYIGYVASQSGFAKDQTLDFHSYEHLAPVLKAMIREENSGAQPYTDAQIDAGLARAGVIPAEKPLHKTNRVKGLQLAGGGTAMTGTLQTLSDSLNTASGTVQGLMPVIDWAKYVFIALTLIGIGITAWSLIEQRRKGIA